MKTARITVAVGCVLLAAACGPSGTKAAPSPSPSTTLPAPPADKGPECVGDSAAKGLHVLRGGAVQLPGGAGSVLYKEAQADGSSRTAVLTNGTGTGTAWAGTETWPVTPGQTLTVGSGAYTVSQICTYRVVLTPKDQNAVTQPPVPNAIDPNWPDLNDGRLRLRWHVPNTDYRGAISAILKNVAADPARADIAVVTGAGGGASYDDARVGDTLEFAGRLWKLTVIDVGDGNPSGANRNSGYVDLQLIGPAGG